MRGDLQIHHRQKPDDATEGQPEEVSKALQEERRNGATRETEETGNAEEREIRGNPEISRRHSQRTRKRGNPGNRRRSARGCVGRGNPENADRAETEEQGEGATRNRIRGWKGRCVIQRATRTSRERQKPKGCWRFRFVRVFFERDAGGAGERRGGFRREQRRR